EPAATNFADNVQFLTNNDYALSGGLTITTGSTDSLAPDGASGSITKYVGGAASGGTQYAYYLAGNEITVTASGVHRFSIFVKAGATNPLNFCMLDVSNFSGATGTTNSYFSLASGTALTTGASIQNYGNGWYRLIAAPITIASGDLTGNMAFAFAEGNNDISWPASGALNLTAYTWGAQMEAGSVATSYIPTTTAAVTRNADVVSVSGAVSGCIGQTEGTIYAEVDIRNLTNADSVRIVSLTTTTNSNNFIEITKRSSTQLRCDARLNSGSTITFLTVSGFVLGVNKIAFAYQDGNYAMAINGAVTTSAQAGMTSSLNTIILGAAASNIAQFNDRIRAAALYTTRLTNDQL
ncbi:MAG: hypothetical protein EBR82_87450, partial [Caulobacteraceae bacterium]|nr:hypothetical protein [Caulobacteraceae bacterium]